MTVVRRILLLAAISTTGIALLAPLAARSSAPVAPPIEEHLLTVDAAPALDVAVDRGTLASRATSVDAGPALTTEILEVDPVPTPGSAPMQATLVSTVTAPPPPAPSRVVTYAGTSVWDDLARCESGGNWAINTGNGYYGGLQFSLSTWQSYGGSGYPHENSRETQIMIAERVRAADGGGYSSWPACSQSLGLPQ
jgi:Transglycosylase-like domain